MLIDLRAVGELSLKPANEQVDWKISLARIIIKLIRMRLFK